jgi:hypothetical protein
MAAEETAAVEDHPSRHLEEDFPAEVGRPLEVEVEVGGLQEAEAHQEEVEEDHPEEDHHPAEDRPEEVVGDHPAEGRPVADHHGHQEDHPGLQAVQADQVDQVDQADQEDPEDQAGPDLQDLPDCRLRLPDQLPVRDGSTGSKRWTSWDPRSSGLQILPTSRPSRECLRGSRTVRSSRSP